MLPKPIISEIIELKNQLLTVYGDAHTQIRKTDEILANQYDAGVPLPFKTTYSARPQSIIDDVKNAIIPYRPTVKVKDLTGTEDGEKRARKREDFANTFFAYNETHSRLPAMTDATLKLAKYGMACLKVEPILKYYLKSAKGENKAEWEQKRKTTFPFLFRSVHPVNIRADVRTEVPTFVIEYCQKTYQDIAVTFPTYRPKEPKKLWDKVEWLAYYDADWRCFLVDDEPVLPGGVALNPCGFQPYIIFYSGYGDLAADGNPSSLALGILTPIIDKLKRETRLDSQEDAIFAVWAWGAKMVNPPPGTQVDESDMDAFVSNLTLAPGKINRNLLNFQVVNVLETLGGEINAIHTAKLMNIEDIERATFAKVIRGVGEEGSGVKNIALIEQGKQKFTPLADSISQAMQKVYENVMRLVENSFGEEVFIGSVSLKPDDIRGEYACEVSLMPPGMTEKMAESQWALQLYSVGGLPMEDALERSGIRDPHQVFVRRLGEDIARQVIPVLGAKVLAEVSEELRKKEELEAIKEAEKVGLPYSPRVSPIPGQQGQMPGQGEGQAIPGAEGGWFQMPVETAGGSPVAR